MKGGKSWREGAIPIGCWSEQVAWPSGRCPEMLRTFPWPTARWPANRGGHQGRRGFSDVARLSHAPSLRSWIPRRFKGFRQLSDIARPGHGLSLQSPHSSNTPWDGGNLRCCAVGWGLLHPGPGSSEKPGEGRSFRCCTLRSAARWTSLMAELLPDLKSAGGGHRSEDWFGEAANLGRARAEVGSQVACGIALRTLRAQLVAAAGWLRHSSTRCSRVAMASRSLAARTSN